MGDESQAFIYEANPAVKILATVVAVIVMGIGAIVLTSESEEQTWWSFVFVAALGAWGLYVWLRILRRRLLLWPGRYEFRGVFRSFNGGKNDLNGYRIRSSRYGNSISFSLKSGSDLSFITPDYRNRPGFREWLSDLPNLDEVERQAFEAALENNTSFGSDAGRRRNAIIVHRQGLRIAVFVASGLALWLFFYPHPLELLMSACALIAVGGIVAAGLSGDRYAIMLDMENPKLKLTYIVLPPMAALGFVVFVSDAWLDKIEAIPLALLVAAALFLLVWRVDGRLSPRPAAIAAACLMAGAWGGVMAFDRFDDATAGRAYAERITDKYISRGSHGHRSYVIRVAPPTGSGLPDSFDVNSREYDVDQPGRTLCVRLHRGALGYRWWEESACAPTSSV